MKKMMKVMAMLVCVAAMTMFTACTKSNEELIIGKWKTISQAANDNVHTLPENQSIVWDFAENGTLVVTMSVGDVSLPAEGTYTVDGDNLTYSVSPDEVMNCTITKLNKKELVFQRVVGEVTHVTNCERM